MLSKHSICKPRLEFGSFQNATNAILSHTGALQGQRGVFRVSRPDNFTYTQLYASLVYFTA